VNGVAKSRQYDELITNLFLGTFVLLNAPLMQMLVLALREANSRMVAGLILKSL
jgi:hypothetical protein